MVQYVQDGGILYFSGAGEPELIRQLLGGSLQGLTTHRRTYIAPAAQYEEMFGWFNEKYPMPIEYRLPMVQLDSSEGVAARITLPRTVPGGKDFASIHSDPPMIATEYPALVIRKVGKGTVIWCAAPVEEDNRLAYQQLLMAILRRFFGEEKQSVIAHGPRQVEVVSFRDGDKIRLSAVDLLYSDERLPFRPVELLVRTDNPAAKVKLLPGGEEIPSRCENGRTVFTLGERELFAMVEIG